MRHVNEGGERDGVLLPDIPILFEDEHIVVVNKPSGVMVHADGYSFEPTVSDWLIARAPEARGVGEEGRAQDGTPLERSGVVHRLDRDTSGVLVLAKTQETFLHLKRQFHDRLVRKEYRAFVYGIMKEQWGTIDRPIGRSAHDPRLRSAEHGARGRLRNAITDWELIGQTITHAYLRLRPRTGRTHQIRAHLKSISRPIIMDPLYATDEMRKGQNLGFERLALHAYSLSIVLPSEEERLFLAPLPSDFERAETLLASA